MYPIPSNIAMLEIKAHSEFVLLIACLAVYFAAFFAAGKLFPKLGTLLRKLIAAGAVILFGALLVFFVL